MVGIFWLLLALIWVPQLWGAELTNIYALGSGAMAVMVLIAVVGISSPKDTVNEIGIEAPDEETIFKMNNLWKGIQYNSFVIGTGHIMISPGGRVKGKTLKQMAIGRTDTKLFPLSDLSSISLQKNITESRIVLQFGEEAYELSFPRGKYAYVEHELLAIPIIAERVFAS